MEDDDDDEQEAGVGAGPAPRPQHPKLITGFLEDPSTAETVL